MIERQRELGTVPEAMIIISLEGKYGRFLEPLIKPFGY